jgi:hypothetical protein
VVFEVVEQHGDGDDDDNISRGGQRWTWYHRPRRLILKYTLDAGRIAAYNDIHELRARPTDVD